MSRCFAYSKTGLRCEEDAGHDGPHSISITWGDDECFDPTKALAFTEKAAALTTAHAAAPPPSAERCEVCDHPMHTQMCPVGSCDCRTGV